MDTSLKATLTLVVMGGFAIFSAPPRSGER
jgi:hypothetical protein